MSQLTINLGSLDQIPLGQGMCFIFDGQEIAVFRNRDGRIFAIENRCPHRRGPLSEGIIGNEQVVCPLHGHKFNLTTGQGSEAHECVKVYRVWAENSRIMMEWKPTDVQKEKKECVAVN